MGTYNFQDAPASSSAAGALFRLAAITEMLMTNTLAAEVHGGDSIGHAAYRRSANGNATAANVPKCASAMEGDTGSSRWRSRHLGNVNVNCNTSTTIRYDTLYYLFVSPIFE